MRIRIAITRALGTAVATAGLAALAGCTGAPVEEKPDAGPSGSLPVRPSAPPQATEAEKAELREAVRDYTVAYYEPDVDAGHAMISRRCRQVVTKEGFAELVRRAEEGNVEHRKYVLERFAIRSIADGSAVVTYGVGDDPRFDLTEHWTREGGAWRQDNCPGWES